MARVTPRGTCVHCDKRVRLNKDGKSYGHHRYTDDFCPGSYEEPLPGSVAVPEASPEPNWFEEHYWTVNFVAALIVGFALGFSVAVGIFEGWRW